MKEIDYKILFVTFVWKCSWRKKPNLGFWHTGIKIHFCHFLPFRWYKFDSFVWNLKARLHSCDSVGWLDSKSTAHIGSGLSLKDYSPLEKTVLVYFLGKKMFTFFTSVLWLREKWLMWDLPHLNLNISGCNLGLRLM